MKKLIATLAVVFLFMVPRVAEAWQVRLTAGDHLKQWVAPQLGAENADKFWIYQDGDEITSGWLHRDGCGVSAISDHLAVSIRACNTFKVFYLGSGDFTVIYRIDGAQRKHPHPR